MRSEIVVKPRTSQKRIVSVRFSPPSFSFEGSRASRSTNTGDRYCEKARVMFCLSRRSAA